MGVCDHPEQELHGQQTGRKDGERGSKRVTGCLRRAGAEQPGEHQLGDLLQAGSGAAGGPVLGQGEVGEPSDCRGENLGGDVAPELS